MNVENGRNRLSENFRIVDSGKLAILRSAVIFGPNASGKSNLLRAIQALKWMICSSHKLEEGGDIPPYEPFRLSEKSAHDAVEFAVEFIVPSGARYYYEVGFTKNRVTNEALYTFPSRQRALVFERRFEDTWETVKFGGAYKGGSRRFSFFENNCYIAKAGNDAAAPDSIREIVRYFRSISTIGAGNKVRMANYFEQASHLDAVAEIICLADTGVKRITAEKKPNTHNDHFPDDMPNELREAIISENSRDYKFWLQSKSGELVRFDEEEMSDGTIKLFEILPILLTSISAGAPILIDELDGHLHTNLVAMILQLFHDPIVNNLGAQLIFTTHDTNIMSPNLLRRDQIWMTSKADGATDLNSLDVYDKNSVRADSPFEAYYLDGRLGALPAVSYAKIRERLLVAVGGKPSPTGE
jgi:AAA15 family ATPase/GTPase